MNESEKQTGNLNQLFAVAAIAIIAVIAQWLSKTFGWSLRETTSIILKTAIGSVIVFVVGIVVSILIRKNPNEEKDGLLLGRFADNPWFTGLFRLPTQKIRHILVTGVTGSGKSTFIRRFIQQILQQESRFLYIDFKGESRDHEQILKICEVAGVRDKLQIFDLSDPKTCLTCNPLTIFDEIEETVGFITRLFFTEESNEYYRAEAERFVRCSLYLMDESGTPRSFLQLQDIFYQPETRAQLIALSRARSGKKGFNDAELFELYFKNEFEVLTARDRNERFSGFLSVLSSFTSGPIRRIFNPAGKSELSLSSMFSENIPVIIRVPGEAYGDLSERVIGAFMKALPVLLAQRRQEANRKEYFLLLDEGCSYMNDTMIDLCKKAGSANVKVVITRMSDADFENIHPSFLGRMLSSISTFICFQTVDPATRETLAKVSMTIDDTKVTRRISQGDETGEVSQRDVQRFRIRPSAFGELKAGECYVISPGIDLFRKVQIFQAEAS